MAALAERRPKAVTAAWLPGCGPGDLDSLKHAAYDGLFSLPAQMRVQ